MAGKEGHRVIFHVDLDAFFAAVEQVINPELADKCVIVGGAGDERSVVASASYQARQRGVRTAMPLAQAKRICPDAYFVPGNFHIYQDFSDRVFSLLRQFTPDIEQASIDEGYLDMTGTQRLFCPQVAGGNWPMVLADRIKRVVKHQTGLNVSIGMASNKLIAKIASKYAKPNGVAMVLAGYERAFITDMPLEAIPGIGSKSIRVLHGQGLRTAGDLRKISPEILKGMFGVAGQIMYYHSLGVGTTELLQPEPPKSISRGTTFHKDTSNRRFLRCMLFYLTERACRELRRQRMQARCVVMTIRYSDFKTVCKRARLNEPTDQDLVVYKRAAELLDRLYTRRMALRFISVGLADLIEQPCRQLTFWDEPDYTKRKRLYEGQDSIREKFGFTSLATGPTLFLLGAYKKNRQGLVLRTACLSR